MISAIVAGRSLGLEMKVIAYDPFLSPDRARGIGVQKVHLNELFAGAFAQTLAFGLLLIREATAKQVDEKAYGAMPAVHPLLRSTLVSIADEAMHVMLVTDADARPAPFIFEVFS